jgi:hypothetical protein
MKPEKRLVIHPINISPLKISIPCLCLRKQINERPRNIFTFSNISQHKWGLGWWLNMQIPILFPDGNKWIVTTKQTSVCLSVFLSVCLWILWTNRSTFFGYLWPIWIFRDNLWLYMDTIIMGQNHNSKLQSVI